MYALAYRLSVACRLIFMRYLATTLFFWWNIGFSTMMIETHHLNGHKLLVLSHSSLGATDFNRFAFFYIRFSFTILGINVIFFVNV